MVKDEEILSYNLGVPISDIPALADESDEIAFIICRKYREKNGRSLLKDMSNVIIDVVNKRNALEKDVKSLNDTLYDLRAENVRLNAFFSHTAGETVVELEEKIHALEAELTKNGVKHDE